MYRTIIPGLVIAISFIGMAQSQTDPQTVLWTQMKKQLSSSDGERYFEANLRGASLPLLKGTLVSALINEGVSRLVLKMPGSEEPDVTLIVYSASVKLAPNPVPGSSIAFAGIGDAFSMNPFMLTFDVDVANLQGVGIVRVDSKNGLRQQ